MSCYETKELQSRSYAYEKKLRSCVIFTMASQPWQQPRDLTRFVKGKTSFTTINYFLATQCPLYSFLQALPTITFVLRVARR